MTTALSVETTELKVDKTENNKEWVFAVAQ